MFCARQLAGAVGDTHKSGTHFDHAAVLFDQSELLEPAYEGVHARSGGSHHFRDDLLRDAWERTSARPAISAAGENQQRARHTLLAVIQQLTEQVGFEVGLSGEEVGDEPTSDHLLRMSR